MRIAFPQQLPVKRISAIAAALALACGLWSGNAGDARAKGIYTVAKVKADATAADAVQAKKRALEEAEQRALQTVFKRLTPFSAYERLPRVKSTLVQEMLENLSVRRERNSTTQYLATLDYVFSPNAIRQFLTGHEIPYSDAQAPRIAVIPVFIQDGAVVSHGRDAWRKAWLELDLENALTPVKLARHGTDLKAEQVNAMLGGDREGFAALKEKYRSEALVLAVAEPAAEGGRLSTRLYGFDAVGPIALARAERVYGGDLKPAAARAAAISLAIFESRWKLTYSAPVDENGVASLQTVSLTVEFAGMKQWQVLRARIARIPGLQALEVNSLSARSADITFRYVGGARRLAAKLPAHKMVLHNAGGVLILRSSE